MSRPTSLIAPLTSPLLQTLAGVRHGFFTREGGVSEGIYASLNAGLGSSDAPAAVAENRRRCAAWFDAPPEALRIPWQVHSATALTVAADDAPWGFERPQGDAVATAASTWICGVLSADCAPVLLADVTARVVAAAHAGWRGALAGVVEATVEAMIAAGAERTRIVAAVGPCIGPASYEVGLDFFEAVCAERPASERFFAAGANAGKRRFDLPAYVLHRLARAGVTAAEALGLDTCAEERFFSNRRALHRGEPDYGRLLSAIRLEAL